MRDLWTILERIFKKIIKIIVETANVPTIQEGDTKIVHTIR